ncbi:MAG: cardiolipin synthase [Nostocaceae cyanobacterium]|nr:cardiolipin synthase [Nostocaceae cyanobacterium]
MNVIKGNIVLILIVIICLFYLLGIANAAHAVMHVHSSRSAIAWGISLITFPWLAIPLYWVLGRSKFQGYAETLHSAYVEHQNLAHQAYSQILKFKVAPPPQFQPLQKLAQTLTLIPFTSGNAVELLVNGDQTYDAMLEAIASAKNYILLQFYIINDDQTGNVFQKALISKAQQGVRVYLLYDEIGSKQITHTYIKSLRKYGVHVSAFHSTKGRGNRFQINFRNHRKILIVDGEKAFVGGLNIGDEYLGKIPHLSPWRDTHMMVQGPAVQCLQSAFLGDWYWATRSIPGVNWQVKPDFQRNQTVFVFPTGPADKLQACILFFVCAINLATRRLWIASPYFVPDDSILTALKLAAMRGVDVRIILPNRPDHLLVYLCSFTYYAEMQAVGVKLYRYQPGFMHQKVILIDEDMAGVGTVNLDNRSLFLNFEVMVFVTGLEFVLSVEKMMTDDFSVSRMVKVSEYDHKSFWFKLAARVSRLLAPVL